MAAQPFRLMVWGYVKRLSTLLVVVFSCLPSCGPLCWHQVFVSCLYPWDCLFFKHQDVRYVFCWIGNLYILDVFFTSASVHGKDSKVHIEAGAILSFRVSSCTIFYTHLHAEISRLRSQQRPNRQERDRLGMQVGQYCVSVRMEDFPQRPTLSLKIHKEISFRVIGMNFRWTHGIGAHSRYIILCFTFSLGAKVRNACV